jgi:hypothetical protein
VIDSKVLSRARDFYAVYMASCEGRNYEGKPCPPWPKLTPAVRGHWYTVALRGLQLQLGDPEAEMLGQETKILPNTGVLEHLGDEARMEAAINTWTEYSTQ